MKVCEMKDLYHGILECIKNYGTFEEGKHYLIYDEPLGIPLFINNKEIEVFAVEVSALEEIRPLGNDLNLKSVYLTFDDISENFKFVHIGPYTKCMGNRYIIKNCLDHGEPGEYHPRSVIQADDDDEGLTWF